MQSPAVQLQGIEGVVIFAKIVERDTCCFELEYTFGARGGRAAE